MRDAERKPYQQILTELVRSTIRNKCLPAHYLTSFVYRRDTGDYNSYLDRKTMDRIWSSHKLHHPLGTAILHNKLFFDRYYQHTGVTLPRTLGYSSNGYVFFGRERLPLQALELALIKCLNSSDTGSLFIKPLDGINGKRCYRFEWSDHNHERVTCMQKELSHGSYIIQETLTQHPALAAIYPHAINTIRLDTFVRSDGSISIVSALMRFGTHGKHVDNGGCFIGVNLDRGVLAKRALCFLHLGGSVYDMHPDTSYRFAGFAIPYFAESKALVIAAARLMPSRLVGWDVAVTPAGPVLIEGNHNYHLGMADTVNQGYRNNPRFQEVLQLI